jgi:5'-nucleotidase
VAVQGAPESAVAGTDVSFSVSGLNMTSRGTPETTSLDVSLGGSPLGTVPVTAGAATVTVTIPAGTAAGASALVLTSATGTTVTVPLTIEEAVPVATSKTTLVALPPLHINGLLHATLIAYVSQSEGRAAGTVVFREGKTVIAEVEVGRLGIASVTLPRLSRGAHQYTAEFVPADTAAVEGSTSKKAKVRVLF